MASSPSHARRGPAAVAAASCGALLLIGLCHLPTIGFGFLDWDDGLHVTQNPSVLAPGSVPLRDLLATPALGYPIPVTNASYALEAQLFGLAPWHFHAINVVLHLSNALLVLALGRRLGLGMLGAVCAALLFGLHPVVAEPVSWVTGRKDLLATCFGLSALWLAWPPRSARRRATSLAVFALGLLSKPGIAPICLLVPLAEQWYGSGEGGRASVRTRALAALRSVAPYLVVLLPIAALGILGQRAAGALSDPERAGASFARATWYALGHHLRLLAGIEEPTAKYLPLPWPPEFTPGVDLMPLMAAGAIACLLFALPQAQRRIASFGLIWSALTYLPSSNLIPLVRYLADSYVYLPLIGAAWCVGGAVDAVVERFERLRPMLRWALPALAIAACVPPLIRSQQRFSDDRALWAHALRRYPYNPRVCRQWANGVTKVRGPEEGLRATDQCLARFGDTLFAKNKGILLGMLGRYEEARVWLERAREDRPSDPGVLRALENLARYR